MLRHTCLTHEGISQNEKRMAYQWVLSNRWVIKFRLETCYLRSSMKEKLGVEGGRDREIRDEKGNMI